MNTHKPLLNRFSLTALLLSALILLALPLTVQAADTGSTQASVSFTGGEMRLNAVPHFDFGSQSITAAAAELEAATVSPDIQVEDLRGKGTGWNLLVSLSPFTLSEGGTPTLNAAEIHLANPTVNAVNGTIGAPPTGYPELVLPSDDTQTPIFAANTNQGMGVWSLSYAPSDSKLFVKPGTAAEGSSAATLTWSLQTTP